MSKRFLLCLLLVLVCAKCSNAAGSLPWLRTNGTHIIDEHGKRVVLNGVNLGSWLVEEMWMMPYQTQPPQGSQLTEIKDHVSLWRNVEQRFGKAEMIRIRTAMRQAWITPGDFDRIRAAGMNCVRLPFTLRSIGRA
jgi:aryl-phospho-beta-D-glucosidase BglC (GH1 family)